VSAAARGRGAGSTPPAARRFGLSVVEELDITRLCSDSRMVRPGDTFVAYPGESQDGRAYIPQALGRGAASVLWESRGFSWNARWRVPNRGIANLRRHAGRIADKVYGEPSRRLWVVGVTGTNGKTSCSHFIAQSLTRAGRPAAVIGTLGSGLPGALAPSPATTPDAIWLHARMAELARGGAEAVSLEASSHGLSQDRLSGVRVDVALLTNLTRDHLDYHRTMRRYRAAKARLFRLPGLQRAVLNLDDPFGLELSRSIARAGGDVLGYGFGRHPRAGVPQVRGNRLEVSAAGVAFDVASPWGHGRLESKLLGRFNAANLLGSLAALLASDVPLEDGVGALRRVQPVPGRLESLGGGRLPRVVIDYAHTPDALDQVLRTLAETGRGGRLICVFGCGGERDRGKRPLMGAVATRVADRVIVTSDNPRREDPARIIADIVAGARGTPQIEPDRARAIALAVSEAARGDIVLIAGKGHEVYQEIGGRRIAFSDRVVARRALTRRAGGRRT